MNEHRNFLVGSGSVKRLITISLGCWAATYMLTVLFPLWLSKWSSTFTDAQVEEKIHSISSTEVADNKSALARASNTVRDIERLNEAINKTELQIDSLEIKDETQAKILDGLIQQQSRRKQMLSKYEKSAIIGGFENNRPKAYIFLSIFMQLIVIFISQRKAAPLPVFLSTTVISYLLLTAPNIVRNFLQSGEDRIIFSYAHADISLSGFLYQEFEIFIIVSLAIWISLSSIYTSREIIAEEVTSNDIREMSSLSTEVSKEFNRLAVVSLLLCIGYIPWIHFYTKNMFYHGDTRYILTMVGFQIVWVTTWIASALPFWFRYRRWEQSERAYICDCNLEEVEDHIKIIEAIRPISEKKVSFLLSASAISFLSPFLQQVIWPTG